MREVIDSSLTDDAADLVFSDYLAAYEEAWRLFPDVLPCLDRLTEFRLGIISNGDERGQRNKLVRTGILDRFEHVVISSAAGCAKPDPEIYNLAKQRLGLDGKDCVVIEDSRNGLLAALGAGMPTLITTSTYTTTEDFKGAAKVVPELGDPPKVLVTLEDLKAIGAQRAA